MGLGQWQDRVGWAWDSDKIGLDKAISEGWAWTLKGQVQG